MSEYHPNLEYWLTFGERGMSSEAIVKRLVYGQNVDTFYYPSDPSDFRRCEKLLRMVPSLRASLPLMAKVSGNWANLVARWADVTKSMEDELPGIFDRKPRARESAPKTYALMQEIFRGTQ